MKQLAVFILILISNGGFSQKEANIWCFGQNAGLDFNSGAPIALTASQMITQEGCASIADSNGNLQFYTDGSTIWAKDHSVMSNGTGLNGHFSSTQSAIIVPKPETPNIYYVFTVDFQGGANGLQYSEVNMSLNGGLGAVTATKNALLLTPVLEKLTAVQHANGKDIWVLAHKNGSAEFYAYLVTNTGIQTPIITNIGISLGGFGYPENAGYMKVSPDGRSLAVVHSRFKNGLQVFDFDSNTGIISNLIDVFYDGAGVGIPYGVEFSPSGELVYVSGSNGIFQYDITLPSAFQILFNATKLEGEIVNDNWGALQLAPDGKIYITRVARDGFPNINTLSVINRPDELGLACNLELDVIPLGAGIAKLGLPPFIQSFFIVGFEYENLCYGDNTQFNANISQAYDSILWDFGDGNTSTIESPTYSYTSSGDYTVMLSVTSGGQTSTDTKTVTIYEQPIANQPQGIMVCDSDNDGFHSFDLTLQNFSILNGQSDVDFDVNYYASMTDYTNDNDIAIPSNYINIASYISQTIVASVKNVKNNSCRAITTFNISVYESPMPSLDVPKLEFCDNTSVGTDSDGLILFDLTQNETLILNGQPASDFTVNYYRDLGLTNSITNLTAYQNTNSTETIYVEVVNKNNTNCKAETSFDIEVFELPNISQIVVLKQCDDDIDGYSTFNLTEVYAEISTNFQNETITFHESQMNAENGSNIIPNEANYSNQTVSTDTVWARVENINGCYRTAQVNLIVSTTLIPNTFIREFYACDDDADGVSQFDFSRIHSEIEGMFPFGQDLIINYYRNEVDALAEYNKIDDIVNYRNIGYPNTQQIYVRVDSKIDNDCLGLGAHIILYVEPQPIANPVIIGRQCDDNNEGEFSFNVSQVESTILKGQSLSEVTVTYFDENNTPLPSPLPNPFLTKSQIISIRITNNNIVDGSCYDETTLEFIVDKQPIANSVLNQISCDDGVDDVDGLHDFDTSLIESTILNGQTNMEIYYYDSSGLELPRPLPNPFISDTQTITVEVVNPLNTSCIATTDIEFIVNALAEFSISTPQIVCSSDSTFTVVLDPIENDVTEIYDYEWVYEDGTMLSNSPTLTVSRSGTYTITLAKTDGTGCSRSRDIFVNTSELANISIDDITIVDVSINNTVTINTNNLGQGDYEFALDDEFSFYQDNPTFENVGSGIHTLYVRDKKGCGTSSIEISIIGFPKFFTPNGDGNNDTWQIKGVNDQFQTNSDIFIYDRYGKLLKQLTTSSKGWDGTFNGKILPTEGYWFRVSLEDGRIFKGHFTLKI